MYLCACSLLAAADVTAGLCTVCCSVFSLFIQTLSISILHLGIYVNMIEYKDRKEDCFYAENSIEIGSFMWR